MRVPSVQRPVLSAEPPGHDGYATVARYLKWLTLVLLAYAVAALLAGPDW